MHSSGKAVKLLRMRRCQNKPVPRHANEARAAEARRRAKRAGPGQRGRRRAVAKRLFISGAALLWLCQAAWAQSAGPPNRDARIDQLEKESAQLKKTVADQERRIAELEKTLKALQAIVAPTPGPLPSPTPAWHSPSSWNQIQLGMSEAQVVQILGPPTHVLAVVDKRTLYYEPEPRSSTAIKGTVTLMDDRVTAMEPPAF